MKLQDARTISASELYDRRIAGHTAVPEREHDSD